MTDPKNDVDEDVVMTPALPTNVEPITMPVEIHIVDEENDDGSKRRKMTTATTTAETTAVVASNNNNNVANSKIFHISLDKQEIIEKFY